MVSLKRLSVSNRLIISFMNIKTQQGFVGLGALIAIVLGLVVVGMSVYYVMQQKHVPTSKPASFNVATPQQKQQSVSDTSVQATTTETPSQSQLVMDLSRVTPQFIEYKQNANVPKMLTPDLESVRQDIKSILGTEDNPQVDVGLIAVGKRYVVATEIRPSDGGSSLQIIDAATTKVINSIPGLYQFTVDKTKVYVSATDICTYTLDTPSCVPIPGAKLSNGEVYGDDGTLAGYFEPQDLIQTDTSMTIAVLALINSNTNQAHLEKVRDITLTLPAQ